MGSLLKTRTPFRILVAVPHIWLRETILQTFYGSNAELQIAQNREELLAEHNKSDLILAEPFGFGEPGLDLLRQIKQQAPSTPLIVLLPLDTHDYRDAVVRIGANSVIATEHLIADLMPTVNRLLERKSLVNGIVHKISQNAQRSAPIGEAAFDDDNLPVSLRNLSNRAVERLATPVPSIFPRTDSPRVDVHPVEEQTFLRGLTIVSNTVTSPTPTRTIRTACNLNCGAHYCGLDVTVHGNHIVKIEPADFPDERYRRICLKGISFTQIVAHPERLLYPLKQMGARGSDDWQRISWDQALDEIAQKICALAERFGMKSVMFFPYSGQLGALNSMNGVYLRLASLIGATGADANRYGVDSAVPSGIEETLGKATGYKANDYADLVNSRLILIWGADPAQSRMNWWSFFMDAKRAGARIVTIDPKFSITASKSDQWLPIRPGTDLYLALAMLRLIVDQEWFDKEFVLRHTVAPFLVRDDTGRFLRAANLHSNSKNGIGLVFDANTRRAISPSDASSPCLTGQFVINGIACRTAWDRLREMLKPYTPALASEKTGLATEQIFELAREFALTKPARIFTLYGIDRWHHGATFGRLIATLAALTGNLGIPGGGAGVDGFPVDVVFNDSFAHPDGKTFVPINPATLAEQIVSGQPYPIKANFVAFSNWLNQWPNQNRLLDQVLPQLDLFVVADHFITETARWADYLLPAATFFEREDMVKGPVPFIQYQPAILPPPGECRADFDIAAGLAQRLGCGEYFERAPREYLAEILAHDESTQTLSFDMLRAQGVLRQNVSPAHQVTHAARQFNTATGRIEFYSERLLPYGKALPDYEAPVEANPNSEQTRRFPLICISEHSRYRVHSTFSGAPWLRELDREPRVAINPTDGAARRITDGNWVRVFNDRGYVVLRAWLTQTVSPGTVYLSQGWQSRDFKAGHAQTLTHERGNPINLFGQNISFSDVLVEIVREPAVAND